MRGNYSASLVVLCLAIAIIACYTALDLASRVSEPLLFTLSVLIALVALLAALWIVLRLRDIPRLVHSAQVAKDAARAALAENEEINAELRAAQSELVNSARQAGMAAIANSVLHNVGNVLNSVNVSADLIRTRLRESRVEGFAQAVELLQKPGEDLGAFLSHDEKGKRLPGYLGKLVAAFVAEQRANLEELEALTRSVDHIKEIVATQQSYAGTACLVEPVYVEALVDDALRMNADSITRRRIAVAKEASPLPAVLLDKHLVLQILVNLIANAKQALEGVVERAHRITLRVGSVPGDGGARLRIQVEDNGEGIASENLKRLFAHGFTTRKGGHGFGLHSSALAAQTMGGTLTAHSAGPGLGAIFTLELPLKPVEGATHASHGLSHEGPLRSEAEWASTVHEEMQ